MDSVFKKLMDWMTRLQGVAGTLSDKIAEIIGGTNNAVLKAILADIFLREPTIKKEMKRIEALVEKVEKIRSPAFDKARDIVFEVAREVASGELRVESLEFSEEAPNSTFNSKLSTLSKKQLSDILEYQPIDGRSISDWFEALQTSDLENITQAVKKASAESISVDGVIKIIRGTPEYDYKDGVLDYTKQGAEKLARTVINGTANNTRLEYLKENLDVMDGVQFLAALDGRTCHLCGIYDGVVWGPEEIDQVKRPPLHINCRCTLVPFHQSGRLKVESGDNSTLNSQPSTFSSTRPAANADFMTLAKEKYESNPKAKKKWSELSASTRKKYYYQAQKDYTARTGNSPYRQIDSRTSFKDYLKEQPEEFQRSWLGKKRYEAFKEGKLKLDDLVKPDTGYRATLEELGLGRVESLELKVESGDNSTLNSPLSTFSSPLPTQFFFKQSTVFEQQETAQEAEKFLFKQTGIIADYTVMPVDTANKINADIMRVIDAGFPMDFIREVGSLVNWPNKRTLGVTDFEERKILIKPLTQLQYIGIMGEKHRNFMFSTNSPNHVNYHEFGHAVINSFYNFNPKMLNDSLMTVNSISKEIKDVSDLSVYGLITPGEAVCESFAQMFNGTMTEKAKEIIKAFFGSNNFTITNNF